jgi:bifunctional UDP-N-acetylglucosamine pyrophosphorylase/glucosamine-1-phosphate N-acetyltransferase
MSAEVDDPTGYGRVVRTEEGSFARIVEEADIDRAGDYDLEHVREVNTGICVVRSEVLFDFLAQLETDNAQGEYYLVDIFELMSAAGRRVEVYTTADTGAVMGVNDRAALAEAACKLRQRTNERLMLAGVTIVDPANTYIESTVKVGRDTVIHPGTVLSGQTVVGEGCEIGPGTDMEDSVVGAECSIVRSTVTSSSVGSNVSIGPYTHIRPDSELADEVRVGNYAKIKNSCVGRETKVSHHCYVGDADIGQRVNMGAGVVTVNYDGYVKHRTVIEDEAFIGCNVNLVAPVKVGSGAYVAAGSTITDDVPEQSLAIARSRQDNRTDWVRRWRQRHEQGRS